VVTDQLQLVVHHCTTSCRNARRPAFRLSRAMRPEPCASAAETSASEDNVWLVVEAELPCAVNARPAVWSRSSLFHTRLIAISRADNRAICRDENSANAAKIGIASKAMAVFGRRKAASKIGL
jgi:hypothetical protein